MSENIFVQTKTWSEHFSAAKIILLEIAFSR